MTDNFYSEFKETRKKFVENKLTRFEIKRVLTLFRLNIKASKFNAFATDLKWKRG